MQDDNESSSSSESSASGQSLPSADHDHDGTYDSRRSSTTTMVATAGTAAAAAAAAAVNGPNVDEDLSLCRADEETVLQAVYAEDFTRKVGSNGRATRLNVHVRPPDTENDHVGTQLTLSLKLQKQYPYVVPTIQLKNVQGLSPDEHRQLMTQLMTRAEQLSQSGSVMMVELVQVTEDFLLEHNRDPTMSAWEQMKEREKREQEQVQQQQQAEMHSLLNPSPTSNYNSRSTLEDNQSWDMSSLSKRFSEAASPAGAGQEVASLDVKRELNRQMAALEDARRIKQSGPNTNHDNTNDHNPTKHLGDSDDDDYSDDQSENDDDLFPPVEQWGGQLTGSRYQADFVELGVLGRGGGGEVVKVRNRLDRRTYAIKKIILESERGEYAKAGAVQNRKLRREVTTISRMTHKNIVRYYQAWVEGDDIETIEEANPERQLSADLDGKTDNNAEGQDDEFSNDSSDNAGAAKYWAKPPLGKFFSRDGDEGIDNSDSSSDVGERENASLSSSGSFSEKEDGTDDNDDDNQDEFTDIKERTNSKASSSCRKMHSQSVEDLLQLENDMHQSPLMTGIGFQQRQEYKGFPQSNSRKRSNSASSEEDIWDESSSVKVDSSQKQRILYIQVIQ